jgi:hypothetical protein
MNPMIASLTAEDLGLNLHDDSAEGVLASVAVRSKQSTRHLGAPASEVFKGAREAVDDFLLTAIETRTEAEFRQVFKAVFPKYVGITMALGAFANAMVPSEVMNRMARESICELESEFREKAAAAFGASVKDQALFTIWTLRKISDLLTQISPSKADSSKRKEMRDYFENFILNAIRANFCLACLKMALHLNRPIYPEVMEGIMDGLRAMVNAYAWARRGIALLAPGIEQNSEADLSDAEDDELLRSSMQDMTFMLDAEETH